tara:strand:- start:1694 stop:3133 length:1440 start_codon:yes stop_codon:yes gene_type:complete
MKNWIAHTYQRIAISFLLSNPRSGLFLDPGMGKTSITLRTIKILRDAGQCRGVLIVAPLRVCYSTWTGEIEKWANFSDLTTTIIHDDNKVSIWGEQKDIYLINPEGLQWLHWELLKGLRAGKKCPVDVLWIDESTKFKTFESERFGLIMDMLPLFKRRHIMTGTPAPRSLLDLWSQMYILDEGKALGVNYHEFRKNHFETEDWNKYSWNIQDFAAERIHEKIGHLVLEMSADDYLDMPPIVYNPIEVILPDKAFKYYKRMERDFFIEIDSLEASAEAAAQSSMKCCQIANGKVYEDVPEDLDDDEIRAFKRTRKTLPVHVAKTEALKDLIEELNGKPILIAYYFKHDLESILKLLRGIKGTTIGHIGSGVSGDESKRIERDWNAGKIDFLLGHPGSMAHGLNLQDGGNDVCWYALPWSLEDYIQLNDRLYRQGVKGTVRIHHLIAKGTLDEVKMARSGERAEQQDDLRTALKNYRLNLI